MSITAGQDILASDFVSTSAGAGDSGKVAKLDSTGKIDTTFHKLHGVRAIQNSGTSLSSSHAILAFQTEQFDTNSYHDNVTNNSRITFPVTGTYLVTVSVKGTSNDIALDIYLLLNGTTEIAHSTGDANLAMNLGQSLSTIRQFSSGDYIEVSAAAGSSMSSSGDEATNFCAILIAQ